MTNIGQYQFDIMKGRSTTDAIHVMKQIIEKSPEFKVKLEILFVDFQQAFDSVNKKKLIEAMKILGIPMKLKLIVHTTLNEIQVSIQTQKGDTDEFNMNKCFL